MFCARCVKPIYRASRQICDRLSWVPGRGSKRHDGRLLRPHADCPEPGEVKGQHALGSRQLGRLVPPMDLAGIMIAT